MKLTTKLITSITILCFLFSCMPEGNKTLEELKEKKLDFEKRITSMEDSLSIVEKKIADLDSNSKISHPFVEFAKARKSSISEEATFQGNVEADKNISISPEISGLVRSIRVKEGQYVSRGKVLATIDSEIMNKNMEEVKKALELANYMFGKQQNLKDQGIGAEANYIQAKNQKESLENKLSTLRTQTSKSYVKAPFSGYIDKIYTKLGEIASPQMPMMRLVNLNKVIVKAEVSESYLLDIQAGDKVSMVFPSIKKTIENAKITSVGKYINPTNRTFPIQIELNNKDQEILPNLIAEVTVEKKYIKEALLIPSQSIMVDNKGAKYAFVYDSEKGKAFKKEVEVLFVKGKDTQISEKSEIKEGDTVITKGGSAITDGSIVKELK